VPYHDAVPLYEYACSACGGRFERLSSFAAADEATCPACGSREARRLLSVIAGGVRTAEPTCGHGACEACS
jgi:putative FmdB family regulatory protein